MSPFVYITMDICDALGLAPGSHAGPLLQIVAAVGAGGKTTLLQRLANELAGRGCCVISTTTTNIWQPAGLLVVETDEQRLLSETARLITPGQIISVAAGRTMLAESPGGPLRAKLSGVASHVPSLLAALPGVAAVLVEADGARGRSLKAPAAHEPVIPPQAAWVLALAGMDAVGKPLNEDSAHRPERIAELLGVTPGGVLTPAHIAALLAHPEGGRKGVPAQARYVPFINKVESEPALTAARAIASGLDSRPGIDRVLIGTALAQDPVLEVWNP